MTEESQKEIDQAVKDAEAVPMPAVEEIFKYVFAEMTPPLKEQLEYLKSTLETAVKSIAHSAYEQSAESGMSRRRKQTIIC